MGGLAALMKAERGSTEKMNTEMPRKIKTRRSTHGCIEAMTAILQIELKLEKLRWLHQK